MPQDEISLSTHPFCLPLQSISQPYLQTSFRPLKKYGSVSCTTQHSNTSWYYLTRSKNMTTKRCNDPCPSPVCIQPRSSSLGSSPTCLFASNKTTFSSAIIFFGLQPHMFIRIQQNNMFQCHHVFMPFQYHGLHYNQITSPCHSNHVIDTKKPKSIASLSHFASSYKPINTMFTCGVLLHPAIQKHIVK